MDAIYSDSKFIICRKYNAASRQVSVGIDPSAVTYSHLYEVVSNGIAHPEFRYFLIPKAKWENAQWRRKAEKVLRRPSCRRFRVHLLNAMLGGITELTE